MDFKRRCKELSKYLYCLCHKCPLHFSMSDIHPKKFSELFFIHLYISVVLKGLDRAESSDIHGFVAHAWDVKCPSIRKMGASLWISDVIFFSSYPFFFMLHLWAVCQKLRNAPGYFEFSRNQNNLERLLPQMKEMSTNKKSNTQRVRS